MFYYIIILFISVFFAKKDSEAFHHLGVLLFMPLRFASWLPASSCVASYVEDDLTITRPTVF